ncbi:MAG: choice-of-anchor V domain-containing protein [Candidatus Kapabacteria bacterium]|jgi:hypothetical protein|nr:choice-of-anchor V domain-containing protein [Candidatus Kapabacteria bacterium]
MKKLYKYLPMMMILSLIVYFTIEAYASSTGRVMRTSTVDGGCGGSGCHGTSSNSSTALSVTSGSLLVEPGSTNSYTVRVSNSNSGIVKAGINIAVKTSVTGSDNIGILEAPIGSGLQVMINELTHTSPKELSEGNADFNFTWTAPDKPGTYFLRAAGNAVNGNGIPDNGDQWNWMTPAELIVRGVELTEPASGEDFCAGRDLIIKWKSAGIENLKISLSTDDGATWGYTISESFKASGGNYTWSIPEDFQQGSEFRIRISDVTDPNRKSEMTGNFGIYGQFSITAQPESKELCPGESITLFVNTTGTGLSYQWRRNGSFIPGETDSVLVLNNLNLGSSGFYGVVVSSPCFSPIISDEANIQVRPPTKIIEQPLTQNICMNGTATFEVDADGQNLKYQWYKGNVSLSGATSNIFIIENVNESHVGSYSCEIKGFCGNVKTESVSLNINSQPVITKQPLAQTKCEDEAFTLSIEADGLDNVYEWFFNGQKLTDETSVNYSVEKSSQSNSGTYYCIVKNNCGVPVKSNEVEIVINPKPKIYDHPTDVTAMLGDEVEFRVLVQNADTYQWRKNGQAIEGATSDVLALESVSVDDAADYDCEIKNDCGTIVSNKAVLIVNTPEPGARIKLVNDKINLGYFFEGQILDTLISGMISNIGDGDLMIDSIRVITPDTDTYFEFVFEDSTVIEPDNSIDLNFKFNAVEVGEKSVQLKIYSNTINDIDEIDISATISVWDMVSNRTKLDFGNLLEVPKSMVFRVFNQSDADVGMLQPEFVGDLCLDAFSMSSPETPIVVSAKSHEDIEVTFNPEFAGEYDCFMELQFYRMDSILRIELVGFYQGMSVESDKFIPEFKSYPNPSNDKFMFEFVTEGISGDCELAIYDLNANIVRKFNTFTESSTTTIAWDGTNEDGVKVGSGAYRAVLKIGNYYKTVNLVIIK